jgi:hypothetical protein
MKKITIILLSGLTFTIMSCGNKGSENKNEEQVVQDTTKESKSVGDETVFNSYDFHKKIISDQFFQKDNTGKPFVINDILITGYQIYNKGNMYPDGAVILEAKAYDPKTKKFLHYFQSGEKTYGATLNV